MHFVRKCNVLDNNKMQSAIFRGSLWQSLAVLMPFSKKRNIMLAETWQCLAETRGVLAVCILFLAVFGSVWQSAGNIKKDITLLFLIGYWHLCKVLL